MKRKKLSVGLICLTLMVTDILPGGFRVSASEVSETADALIQTQTEETESAEMESEMQEENIAAEDASTESALEKQEAESDEETFHESETESETESKTEEERQENTDAPATTEDADAESEIADDSEATEDANAESEIAEAESTVENSKESETEPEVSEAEKVLTASATDIASGQYTENGSNITWVIDENGKLTVEGSGEFSKHDSYVADAPWKSYADSIKSAEIKVTGMTNASYMFYDCKNLTSVDLSGFDTSTVTNMKSMFNGCESLASVDVSSFKTGSVTDMSSMFQSCKSLTSVDLSSFDTSNVTNMGAMFFWCEKLTNINLSSFKTGNVKFMDNMFAECKSLTSLDVSGFDTSNVSSMYQMFINCSGLTSLDVSKFNTSSLTSLKSMFEGCSGLTSLDVSSFDTSNVTDMGYIFFNCSSLTSLDLSNFDTANVTDMRSLFNSCKSLTSLDISNFDTRNVTNIEWMFYNCSSLTGLDISNLNISKVTSLEHLFEGCSGLTSLDVSHFDTSKITNMEAMFAGCSGLTSLDVSHFNTGNVTNINSMFFKCSSLTSLDLSNFDTRKVYTMGGSSIRYGEGMFEGCTNLKSVNVSSFDTSNVTSMKHMFRYCESLTMLDLSNFDTSNVTNMDYMFDNCSSLTSLDISSFNTAKVDNSYEMARILLDCGNLSVIYAPCNLSQEVYMPGDSRFDVWYDWEGTQYTRLPQNLGYSIAIMKNQKPFTSTITATKAKTAYERGDTLNMDDLTVYYYDDKGKPTKVTEGYTTNADTIDMSAIGKKTLRITYNNMTADVDIVVGNIYTVTFTGTGKDDIAEGTQDWVEAGADYTFTLQKKDGSLYNVSAVIGEETVTPTPDAAGTMFTIPAVKGSLVITIERQEGFPIEWEYPESLKVERTEITADNVEVKAKKRIYDGTPYTPDVKVTVTANGKKTVLTNGADYTVKYSNNVNAGENTGKVTIKGNGAYKGTVTKTFTISQKPIKKLKTVAGGMIVGADINTELSKTIHVYDGTKELTYNEDYTLELTKGDTTKKGKLQVAVLAKDGSNYTGTGKDAAKAAVTVYETTGKNFKGIINPDDVAFEKESDASQTYTGKALKPAFKVTVNGTALGKKEFAVKYTNNKEAGRAYATITGKGGYVGSVVKTFEITPIAESDGFRLKKVITPPTYNGKLQKPKVTIVSGNKSLKAGKDYRIVYNNNLHATPENAADEKKAKITVTGIGNYKGMNGTFYFEIKPLEIKKAKVKGTQDNLDITYAKRPLIENYDYEITNVTSDGKKAQVTLTGTDDFTGTVTKSVNATK